MELSESLTNLVRSVIQGTTPWASRAREPITREVWVAPGWERILIIYAEKVLVQIETLDGAMQLRTWADSYKSS